MEWGYCVERGGAGGVQAIGPNRCLIGCLGSDVVAGHTSLGFLATDSVNGGKWSSFLLFRV